MSILNYLRRIKTIGRLLKRLELLFLREELLDFVIELDLRYNETNEWCKKKEWRVYDNIHKTLNVVEQKKGEELENEIESSVDKKWYLDRAVDTSLKTFIVIGK